MESQGFFFFFKLEHNMIRFTFCNPIGYNIFLNVQPKPAYYNLSLFLHAYFFVGVKKISHKKSVSVYEVSNHMCVSRHFLALITQPFLPGPVFHSFNYLWRSPLNPHASLHLRDELW